MSPDSPSSPNAPKSSDPEQKPVTVASTQADLVTDPNDELPTRQQEEATMETPMLNPMQATGWMGRLRSMNIFEKFCCLLIAAGMVGFAGLVFFPALLDFQSETELSESGDFPMDGEWIKVRAAETYWREPVTEGPNADTMRAGTAFLPVLDMQLGGKGSVRILFRNNEGNVVGDPIKLEISKEQDVSAACTMGLMERSDFAAYRTDESEDWIVEFREASPGSSSADEHALLFKMTISPTLK